MITSSYKEDKSLVSRLKSGDIKAFDNLFQKYSSKLHGFSLSLLKNDEDAKEIVQETFLKIWKKRKEIDSSKSFKSFLFTISYNLIIDQLRSKAKDREFIKQLSIITNHSNNRDEIKIDYDIISKKVQKAVEELPGKRKAIYKLSREEGLSHKEIATKLNITPKTVENQIALTLKHLKSVLGKDILPVMLFICLFA